MTDGILSKLFRELNDRPLPGKESETRWIVFDGDVDALWVENMNSGMYVCVCMYVLYIVHAWRLCEIFDARSPSKDMYLKICIYAFYRDYSSVSIPPSVTDALIGTFVQCQ